MDAFQAKEVTGKIQRLPEMRCRAPALSAKGQVAAVRFPSPREPQLSAKRARIKSTQETLVGARFTQPSPNRHVTCLTVLLSEL